MEVYIESILLLQLLVHGLCFLVALIFSNKLVDKKGILLYLILISFISLNVLFKLPSTLVYGYLFMIHLFYFKKDGFIFYLSYMLFYQFFIFILLQINPYSIYQDSLIIIYKWQHILLNTLLFSTLFIAYLIHAFVLKKQLVMTQLVYPVQFVYRGKAYNLKGYLDTGNKATYKGIPIIFIKEGIIDQQEDEIIEVNTLNDVTQVAVFYMRNIEIGNERINEVYFGSAKELLIEEECLLNVALLYKG